MPHWQGIIVHHSEGHDASGLNTDDIRRYHKTELGWQDIGYHFLVEKVEEGYELIGGRPLDMNGAHCPGSNATHVGVCLVGNFNLAAPPTAQLDAAARYIRGLMAALDIPRQEIFLHREKGNTDCPGRFFEKEMIMSRV